MTVQEEVVQFRGAEDNQIVATRFDSGSSDHPPVILMHGGGQTRHSWNDVGRKLATLGLVTYSVDARGHGESAWVDSRNYSFWHYRDDLLEISEQVRSRHSRAPILVGASLGGITAMLAQEVNAEVFSAIILVDITPRMEMSGVDKIQGFMGAQMNEGFASVEEAAEAIASYLPNRKRPKSLDGLRKNLRLRADNRWYWHWDPAFVSGPASINSGLAEGFEKLERAAGAIRVPTLLVRGQRSELVTEAAAQEFLELVPHAKLADVSDAGHMVAGDNNAVFAGAVIGFLHSDVLQSA